MKFLFLNTDSAATFLVERESSFATQYDDQAEIIQQLKARAVKAFNEAYEGAKSPDEITDNVLHPLWKKLGVTFGVATIVSRPTEDWPVKVELVPEPIVIVHFWVAPAAQVTQVTEVE